MHLEPLPSDTQALQVIIQEQQKRIKERDAEVERLIEIILGLRRRHFGPRTEKDKGHEQLGLFNEPEEDAAAFANEEHGEEDEKITIGTHERNKPKRKPIPEDLPREVRVIVLSEEERKCPHDGTLMHESGEEVSEKYDVVPMQIRVIRTVRKTYACKTCEDCMKTAPVPAQLLPKSLASEGTLASVITWKYQDHIPLYRCETIFERVGIELKRGTLAHWMIGVGERIQPLINLLNDDIIDDTYLQMDETRVQVLQEPGKRAESLSYMWVRARPGRNPIILFEYDPTRSGAVPVKLLEGFKGHLQTDGYEGYNRVAALPGMTRGGCFAHCRRRFFEAAQDSKKAGIGNHGKKLIQKLYAIEKTSDASNPDYRYQLRQERACPILSEMREWISEVLPRVVPKTAAGKALLYAHNEWPHLVRYIDDGRYEIDTNFVENYIRPFALGRKNWLFSATVDGARASANIYSLVTTAKANGLETYLYLRYVLEHLPLARTVDDFAALLPTAVRQRFQQKQLN